MLFLACPDCGWPVVVPPQLRGRQHFHRCLFCDQCFDLSAAPELVPELPPKIRGAQTAQPPAPAPQPAVAPVPPPRSVQQSEPDEAPQRTHLTAPHLCSHCEAELPATGQRRSNRTCPGCQRPTSVYAVLYRCPNCDALLESPSRQQEARGRCPVCNDFLMVPCDVLFNDGREPPDHTWFAFPCPSCHQELRSPPAGANRSAVCPHCWRVVPIPKGGDGIVPNPVRPDPEPVEWLQAERTRPCPVCGLVMAARGRVCRGCGSPIA
jgi:hypothetical protein